MNGLRIGELFAGYGGLGMGVQRVLGGNVVWYSDVCKFDKDGNAGHYEPHRGACRILAHRLPDVPNLGDITAVDWSQVEPVDVLTGGFPCQDVSSAGERRGMRPDTRSGLWTHMAYAIDKLRPALVVAENVRGLTSAEAHSDLEPCPWCVGEGTNGHLRALGAVLGDLADLGYDARWYGLRAADIGAPHGRFRIFLAATQHAPGQGLQGQAGGRIQPSLPGAGHRGSGVATDASRQRHGWEQDARVVGCLGGEDAGRSQQRERSREVASDRGHATDWGQYAAAIHRWERLTRPAPGPVLPGRGDKSRLSPAFVEWMMGLPAGWVTDVPGVTRNEALKALGNGVVPQQAEAALRVLLGAASVAVA